MSSQENLSPNPDSRVVFSAPELLEIRTALQELAASFQRTQERVWFDANLSGDHIEATLRFSTEDESESLSLEAAVETNPKSAEEVMEARTLVVEFVGAMFEEWLEDSALKSPSLDWKEHEYAGKVFLFRGEYSHPQLDQSADDFLRAHGLDPDHLWEDSDYEE